MNSRKAFKSLVLLLFVACSNMVVSAQLGNVEGTISDENGINVPGANIIISELKKGAISDFDGRFSLVGIPAGNYTLNITYLGYADITQEVVVKERETASVSIFITPKTLELDGVEVTGFGLGSQARALNTQRTNMNITNVVATDQIGKFPDANIGDAVKRIPGITMQVDQGEARNIIVRGLSPQLNSVSLNGSRVPSAEGDNRNVQMDLIPADMIQSIEVSKAVTPDMDADALGGSVNLVTRTSPQGFRLSSTLGSGVNFITDKPIINGSFLLGNRSDNGKFGWMVSASYNDNDFGSDNVEAEWSDEFEYYTGSDDVDGEPILEEVDVNPYTSAFEQREYLVQRVRRSLSANFDYRFDANNSIFLKSIYNWRDDRENRFVLQSEILDGEDIEIGDFTVNQGNLTRFPAEITRETKGGIDNSRNKNRRLEDQRMQNYSLGGNHLWGSLKMDWMTSFAKASEERLNERYIVFENEYAVRNDNSSSRYPLMTAENSADADLSNFEYDEVTEENQFTKEEDFNVFVNFEVPSDFFGNGDGSIKFGGRARMKTKLRDNDFFEYDLEDDFPTLADVAQRDLSDTKFLAGSQYVAGSFADEKWLGALDLVDGESVPDEFLRANFNVDENVFAAYAMTNQKITEKLSVLFGLRLEATKVTAVGNSIIDEEDLVGKITEESSYTNVLPGLHLKYDLSDATILRLAWTNTLARPNYEDLVPSLDVVSGDEEIYLGNPELAATTSMNFDVMAEHYFRSVGILSGGLFYKNIDNFIYLSRSETSDNFYGDDTAGFEIFQPLNGDGARIFGAEIAFQRQLDFLPGFARNFSLYLNYTFISSSAEGIKNEDGEDREGIDLPNTTPNTFNASLGYNDKKFSARMSVNFSDAYIDELGGNEFEDRYYDTQLFLDFNASYKITNSLSVYADLNNISNQPLRYFQGVKGRTQQIEFYGRRLTFGLKYDLFKR
ncbi:TonB-dependent receptor [Zobellia galactanivorans]|uniref:TonB-dependent receptor n=1 Tax=Zobellia galactanivorans (strain DSM 12802 / CCUG 47099 / CIP 106680 / NCIMB 13871 / Dsij) TaxID=63186 RepID=UPI001C06E4EB|nr:TonB-dependent receptor [Zobellia galactanivorans]MBU3028111.1 TonB-dependent receptor [Zobellia galactanivorans]